MIRSLHAHAHRRSEGVASLLHCLALQPRLRRHALLLLLLRDPRPRHRLLHLPHRRRVRVLLAALARRPVRLWTGRGQLRRGRRRCGHESRRRLAARRRLCNQMRALHLPKQLLALVRPRVRRRPVLRLCAAQPRQLLPRRAELRVDGASPLAARLLGAAHLVGGGGGGGQLRRQLRVAQREALDLAFISRSLVVRFVVN
mmetsp:Transcript_31154/g.91956  ORF Transcript_31154/g.91956 Transcript_31154/m.91956 type:complete len:200 (+) Transcript_31154:58-657(+)